MAGFLFFSFIIVSYGVGVWVGMKIKETNPLRKKQRVEIKEETDGTQDFQEGDKKCQTTAKQKLSLPGSSFEVERYSLLLQH